MNETTNEQEVLLLRRKLDLLLRTGKLLMESAADTNRIERNMKRVAAYLGIPEEKLHIDIRWTMLMVNVSDEKHSFSKFQKCEKHGINMEAISKISKLSWRAIEQDYSLDKYEEELEKIARQERNYTPYVVAICTGFACGGFCKLFGGDWIAFLITAICTFVGFRTRARCIEFGINVYMSIAISAFLCTCLAYAFSFSGLSSTPYHPLLACTLYIVPGVPLINFVDDMIDNHLLVGITRAANTVMMVGGMAFGIAFALRLLVMSDVTIDQKFSELSMVPHDAYWVYAVAAAIAAMGFATIFNVQRRLLWVETQEELAGYLKEAGFTVTQATVSRDIRELKLSKVPTGGGKQKYVILRQDDSHMGDKYIRVLRDGFVSMDMAQNILVIKTVSGMAMAVAAALDALKFSEVVGCIAGDDTIMVAVRTVEDTQILMDKIHLMIER